jgi:uncharacterized membrane protein YhaH (DUF805 family)
MGFGEAIITCFQKYAMFNGRAPRSEYWWFVLFVFLAEVAAMIIDTGAHLGFVTDIVELALLLPQISVAVRRIHDINRSGWWVGGMYIFFFLVIVVAAVSSLFIHPSSVAPATDNFPTAVAVIVAVCGLIGFVYGITLFVFSVTRGTDGPNDYGPDPLAVPSEQTTMRPNP